MIGVRPATLNDLSNICAWGKTKHAESNYGVEYNATWFRRVLKASMGDADSCVFITVINGEVRGLLIGCRTPMLFSPMYCATDQVFVADAGGDLLLDAFLGWARSKRVRRIDMGNSQQDRRGMDRFMRSRGLQRAGGMYFLNCEVVP